jgi:hypothetical protein
MSNDSVGVGPVMAAVRYVLVLAAILTACAGKKRPFGDEALEAAASNQPSSTQDASVPTSPYPGSPAERQGIDPENPESSARAGAGELDDSSCETGVDGGCGSAPPCAADAICETT